MKKIFVVLLSFLMLFSFNFANFANAESEIKVIIDNEQQQYTQPPVIINGTTLVPMRGIFEELGATVNWDGNTKTVLATTEKDTILIVIGNKTALVNNKQVTLSQSAQIINGSTMVPLRFVSESLGAKVDWDGNTKTIYITKPIIAKTLTSEENATLNDEKVIIIETDYGFGSGVIIKDGLVLTNYHVVDTTSKATITTNDGKTFGTEGIVVYDEQADLAVLKMDSKLGIEPVKIGDYTKVAKGQDIVTIGNPYGLQNTTSTGIISGLRTENGINLFQISAPITYGSSGGGLFNEKGELIGITSGGYGDGNLNFAVSVEHIKGWMNNELAVEHENLVGAFNRLYSGEEIYEMFNNDLTLEVGSQTYNLETYEVYDDDYYLEIYGVIGRDEYQKYFNNYSLNEEAIKQWAEDMAVYLREISPNANIFFSLVYYEETEYDPTGLYFIDPDDVWYYEYDDSWAVYHSVVDIDISSDGIIIDVRQ